MSQCLAEHNVYNALHCRYMKQDGCFQWCTMYSAQISRLARPCCVPAPSRIQTPDNCPPQLLPHAPLPPNHDPRMETFFWDKLALAGFQPSAMQGVCNMDFLPSFSLTPEASENMPAWPIEMEHKFSTLSILKIDSKDVMKFFQG